MILGFIASIFLRVIIGLPHVAQSTFAGIVFAVCLLFLTMLAGIRLQFSWRVLGIGISGGIALLIVPLLMHAYYHGIWQTGAGYWSWALGASIVAACEELFLRGALFTLLQVWLGDSSAVCISALLFALLHLPLYGWHSVLLDVGVGVLLGTLRLMSGTVVSPIIAHVLADLGGWWLR